MKAEEVGMMMYAIPVNELESEHSCDVFIHWLVGIFYPVVLISLLFIIYCLKLLFFFALFFLFCISIYRNILFSWLYGPHTAPDIHCKNKDCNQQTE